MDVRERSLGSHSKAIRRSNMRKPSAVYRLLVVLQIDYLISTGLKDALKW